MSWAAAAAAAAQAYGQYQMNKQSFGQSQASSDRAFALNFWAQNYFMDKQNEYNKPINQMKRLEEAGLNPNLVYGSGADALSASPSGGGAQGVTFPHTKMSLDVIEKKHMLNSIRQQDANIARTEADTRAVNENLDIMKARLALERARVGAEINRINATTKSIDADRTKKEFTSDLYSDPAGTLSNIFEGVGRSVMNGAYDFGRNLVRSFRSR